MASTSTRGRRQAIGFETGRNGSAVAATHRLFGRMNLGLDQPNTGIEEDFGAFSRFLHTYQGLKMGAGTFQGAFYLEDAVFWFNMICKALATPSTASSGSAPNKTPNVWAFPADETSDTVKSTTLEWTDFTQSWQAANAILTSFQLNAAINSPVQVQAGWIYPDKTTSTETSLATSATRTPVIGAMTKLYIDDTSGNFATTPTPVTGTMLGWNFGITTNFGLLHLMDGTLKASDADRGARDVSCSIQMRMGSTALAEIAKWGSAAERDIELRLIGPALDAATYAASNEMVKLQMSGVWTAKTHGESGNTALVTLNLQPRYESTVASNVRCIYSGAIANLAGL